MIVAQKIANICVNALKNGHKILFIGNGGSAADSQHLAAELVGKLNYDRAPLDAIALTSNTSVITAIGNDYGYENTFSRQVAAHGKEGDVLIAMSTSGNSENVLKAIETAKNRKMIVIGKTGKLGGKMADMCDLIIQAPSLSTQKIQEYHMQIGHIYCGIIEEELFPQ